MVNSRVRRTPFACSACSSSMTPCFSRRAPSASPEEIVGARRGGAGAAAAAGSSPSLRLSSSGMTVRLGLAPAGGSLTGSVEGSAAEGPLDPPPGGCGGAAAPLAKALMADDSREGAEEEDEPVECECAVAAAGAPTSSSRSSSEESSSFFLVAELSATAFSMASRICCAICREELAWP